MKYRAITMLSLVACLLAPDAQRSFAQSARQTASALVQPTPRPVRVAETPRNAPKVASDTTLIYYEVVNKLFDVSLRRESAFVVRSVGMIVNASFDGAIDRVDFELSNFAPSPGVAGTGKLRIKLIELPFITTNPPYQPAVDSIDVDLSALTAREFVSPGDFINQIDLTGHDFEIRADEQYFLQLSLVEESADAALTFVFDGGSKDSTDTRYFIPPDFGARSLVYLDSLAAQTNDCGDVTTECDDFLSLRDSGDTTMVHLNVLLELQLSRTAQPPPPPPPPPARAVMQFINNAPALGSVDVYVGDSLIDKEVDFREASEAQSVVPAGEQTINLFPTGDPGTGTPLFSETLTLAENQVHWVVVLGATSQTLDLVAANQQGVSSGSGMISYVALHGASGADPIDLNVLDETPTHAVVEVIASGLAFGSFSAPKALAVGDLNVEVAADGTQLDVFRLAVESGGEIGTASDVLLLMTSGIVGGDPALALLTFNAKGVVGVAPVSTATESLAVPENFALHANYPNPFNPTTTIRFDLGAPGFTTLRVFNLLGQEVARLVAEPLAAGAYAIAFDAAGLPSGPYIYRLTSGAYHAQRMLVLVR